MSENKLMPDYVAQILLLLRESLCNMKFLYVGTEILLSDYNKTDGATADETLSLLTARYDGPDYFYLRQLCESTLTLASIVCSEIEEGKNERNAILSEMQLAKNRLEALEKGIEDTAKGLVSISDPILRFLERTELT
jgi:hypothetical protein